MNVHYEDAVRAIDGIFAAIRAAGDQIQLTGTRARGAPEDRLQPLFDKGAQAKNLLPVNPVHSCQLIIELATELAVRAGNSHPAAIMGLTNQIHHTLQLLHCYATDHDRRVETAPATTRREFDEPVDWQEYELLDTAGERRAGPTWLTNTEAYRRNSNLQAEGLGWKWAMR